MPASQSVCWDSVAVAGMGKVPASQSLGVGRKSGVIHNFGDQGCTEIGITDVLSQNSVYDE